MLGMFTASFFVEQGQIIFDVVGEFFLLVHFSGWLLLGLRCQATCEQGSRQSNAWEKQNLVTYKLTNVDG
jgi:hypothetical protein